MANKDSKLTLTDYYWLLTHMMVPIPSDDNDESKQIMHPLVLSPDEW